MTVRRRRRTSIEASPQRVLAAIEKVSNSKDRYRAARPSSESQWVVIVRPRAFMLPTQLTASATETVGGNTELVVTTTSQWFIWGDIFREYDRQIDRFVEDVESAIVGTA